jgi:hypothetical protein
MSQDESISLWLRLTGRFVFLEQQLDGVRKLMSRFPFPIEMTQEDTNKLYLVETELEEVSRLLSRVNTYLSR